MEEGWVVVRPPGWRAMRRWAPAPNCALHPASSPPPPSPTLPPLRGKGDERLTLHLARGRVPLRGRAVRGRVAADGRGAELQLLDVRQDRLHPRHLAGEPVPAHEGRRATGRVQLQHAGGEASVLRGVRGEELLPAA